MTTEHERSRRGVLRGAAAVTLGTGFAAGATAGTAAAVGGTARADEPVSGASARERSGRRLDVAVLLYDGFTALDAVGPYETLCRVPGVRVTMVARRAGPVRTDTGELSVTAERSLREMPRADVLLVPGGGERGTTTTMADAGTLDWIRRVHRRSTWTTSVCTGALILGAAGLLRGLPATTHWASGPYLGEFGATYTPGRFVEAGKIITAAGVSAGVDMALHLAARLSDEKVAQATQLALEYDPDPPYDTGSPEKADAELRALALRLIADAAV
ncbi:DJ-1/PfpI family protein [Streptomyces uncialis]|uniref:Thiamine biosynthesis protein ThiJ n=1 Tax=Streptomyces uncialis TaxID=1048205 RepID=A0A1Q4V9Z8_9ACTN|nr:DJ-1/PfpI family protein [Streptomyces uncialis]OKH94665.1 thiamine biosynthesis protein ThiJ [Streptomyces uncialis]